MDIFSTIATELNISVKQTEAAVKLLDEGNTVPFIARYRKEVTGSLDDQVLRKLSDRLTYLRNFEERLETVRAAILEQEKMTDEIEALLNNAKTLSELEDIYRPFKPKRKTRASIAREKGLQPLADEILKQEKNSPKPLKLAEEYVNEEKGVNSAEEALQGAMDIIAETVSDTPQTRKLLRELAIREGFIDSVNAKEEDSVYRLYYQFSEPVRKIAGHRVLAIDRGEKEDFLKVNLNLDREKALDVLYNAFVKNVSPCNDTVILSAQDAYDRLIFPSIEREIRSMLTENACESAIGVFGINLHSLLMQAPLKGCTVLGLDPAYRTGCKIAVVDPTGKVLDTTVIYPTPPQSKIEQSEQILLKLIKKHNVSVISMGNGTASKESEIFVSDMIKKYSLNVKYMVVNEAGASVYSASKLAAEEFPDYDVSLRSAVSIARRLQDPLAELVKIDPKAIGVGQYQHDMPQNRLSETLSNVVVDCVNSVGVDLNTASIPLLSRVSGVNAGIAKNIVAYREENGAFTARNQLLKVSKLGKKAYEQCAGFLHIPESENILDNTFVHPESYGAAKELISLCGYDKNEKDFSEIGNKAKALGLDKIAAQLGIGIPTLSDMLSELQKPGRDLRDDLPAPMLVSGVMDMNDLKPGMELKGTVRNCVDFGAFVDIGVHQDGLVHISQICDKFIKHPSEVLKVGDIVTVKVLECDPKKKRISLTMRLK